MDQQESMEPREEGAGMVGKRNRVRVVRRLLGIALVLVTSSGLLSISGCREQSDVDEAVEEMKDEMHDTKDEIEDEIDDHT